MAIENAKTVERAVRLLFDLADNPAGFTATELALRLETQRPPLYRLLKTLTEYRLIRRDEFKIYTLSVGVLELARAVAGTLESIARPVLQGLANATNATAILVLAEGDALITAVSVMPASQEMHLNTPVGFRHPDGETPPRIAIRTLQPALADDSDQLRHARQLGYAVSHGLTEVGRSAVAVPLRLGPRHPLASILLVTTRDHDDELFGRLAMESAAEISRLIDVGIA
jgi:DNA-binding IclR family transcriptional regulator